MIHQFAYPRGIESCNITLMSWEQVRKEVFGEHTNFTLHSVVEQEARGDGRPVKPPPSSPSLTEMGHSIVRLHLRVYARQARGAMEPGLDALSGPEVSLMPSRLAEAVGSAEPLLHAPGLVCRTEYRITSTKT
jgi:hypothetical protein